MLPSASKVRGKNNEFGLVKEEKAALHLFLISETYDFSLGGVMFSVDPSSDLQIDFYPVNWKTLCLVFPQGSDGSLFSRADCSECFADNFLSISRAMEDLENNTTVFSTLRSLNNFISQRMEGVSGLATPGSSQSSLQMQYQQRMQVRSPHLGDSCSIISVWLCPPFDSRSWD